MTRFAGSDKATNPIGNRIVANANLHGRRHPLDRSKLITVRI